mmetsp:Transcript_19615/g.18695  ORF Transcript_19615/g.18695 Transcript_19615/m.18695 type:complete len:228 (+) Transcript_19615:921-1604(+)
MQEQVLLFVNHISEIVHSCVDKFGGSPNKNLGDTFLLVWKPESFCLSDSVIPKKTQNHKAVMADLALFSILKIISKINSLQTLKKYRTDFKMEERINNYRVSIGFGLHFGWAIEGAIGSEFKVDLSYLSPNVNLASRLCAATKQYGVDILFSEQVQSLLSERIKEMTREVDCVTLKGSKQALNLFTVDLDPNNLPEKIDKFEGLTQKKRKKTLNIEKRIVQKKVLSG